MAKENSSLNLQWNLQEWQLNPHPNYALLPIDNNYEQVFIRNVVFSESQIRPLDRNVRLVCISNDALTQILNLEPEVGYSADFIDFVAGRKMPSGAFPVAHRYGGHQYGMWISQLGDGRAHIVGEFVNRLGERWQIQLKGSGPTPYSRSYDGRAVLRSSIREMVASEACHFLGIPTTRSAALVVSDEAVIRDQYHNGNPKVEKAAMLLRLAPCWFRFGSLEIHGYDEELPLLSHLCDFIIKVYFPSIPLNDEKRYIRLFSEISHKTLDMLAKWQGCGFAHGLLNTDNMSILGLTIDYGPFGFVECYDSGYVPNSSDSEGRYSLAKQPDAVLWNISQLANAFKPLLTDSQICEMSQLMKSLVIYCRRNILETFLLKLGLKDDRWGDEQFVEKLLDMMEETGADFTCTFRQLAELQPKEMALSENLKEKWCLKQLSSHSSWGCWLDQYCQRIEKEAGLHDATAFEIERRRRMSCVNPVYIPRNWMIHEAIQDAENDDFHKVRFLMEILKNPYEIQEEAEICGFSSPPPLWAHTLKISCSS